MHLFTLRLCGVVLLLLVLAGCGPAAGGNVTGVNNGSGVETAPSITSFTANPTNIQAGGTSQLTGVWVDGTGVINPGNLSVINGIPVSVTPAETTKYTLSVSNAQYTTTATVTVTVGTSTSTNLIIPIPDVSNPGTTVPLELVLIPAGQFLMGAYPGEPYSLGDETPQHTVTVGYSFYVAIYQTTQAQWKAVTGSNPSWFSVSGGHANTDELTRPVEQVSWNGICTSPNNFLARLNAATAASLPTGWAFRLPSEAEWEYACRAGTTTSYYWGDDQFWTDINNYAWWQGNSGPSEAQASTQPAGQLMPNSFGLYDMSGNVYQWCEDDYHDNYKGAPADGSAWVDSPRGTYRIVRGGSWASDATLCRSAYRDGYDLTWHNPSDISNLLGFRVVLAKP